MSNYVSDCFRFDGKYPSVGLECKRLIILPSDTDDGFMPMEVTKVTLKGLMTIDLLWKY